VALPSASSVCFRILDRRNRYSSSIKWRLYLPIRPALASALSLALRLASESVEDGAYTLGRAVLAQFAVIAFCGIDARVYELGSTNEKQFSSEAIQLSLHKIAYSWLDFNLSIFFSSASRGSYYL
jgi:hypothetical protein